MRTSRNLFVRNVRIYFFRNNRTRTKSLQDTEMVVSLQEVTLSLILSLILLGHTRRLQFVNQTEEMMNITNPVVAGSPNVEIVRSLTTVPHFVIRR